MSSRVLMLDDPKLLETGIDAYSADVLQRNIDFAVSMEEAWYYVNCSGNRYEAG